MGREAQAFSRCQLACAVGAAALLSAAPATAIPVTFTTIANETTAIPAGTGVFTQFQIPTLDRGRVAFFAQGVSGQSGVYTARIGEAVTRVADETTSDPGTGTAFTAFGDPDVDGDRVAFAANGPGVIGVYTGTGGGSGVSTVADTSDAIPGGTGNFSVFSGVGADAGQVVFEGLGDSGQNGIYVASGGSLSRVADTTTAIPGGTGDFGAFLSPQIDSGAVVFSGSGSDPFTQRGFYSDRSGSLDVVDDLDAATQPVVGEADISHGAVAYHALTDNGTGSAILLDTSLSVLTVADDDTPIPEGVGTFSFFNGDPALDDDLVVFRGNGTGGQDGVYLSNSLGLHKIVEKGDSLDGKVVSSAAVRPGGLHGRDIAFFAFFNDGSGGVYVASVPEPGTAALLAVGLAVLAVRARRGRHA